jgi:hypothetical protein
MIRGVPNTNERPQVRENSSATAMLGLEGMAVLAVSERDGEVEFAIETAAATGWCPVCNGPTEAVNLLIKKILRVGLNRPSGPGQPRVRSSSDS